jgi:hypothetical protein
VLAAVKPRLDDEAQPLTASIDQAEAAMRREQSQWGQLSLEAEPPR